MRILMVLVLGLVLLPGCGRAPMGAGEVVEHGLARACGESACPMSFPSAGLCAGVVWKRPPTADAPGDFEIRFWVKGKGTLEEGPYQTPSVDPKSFLIMKCCNRPTAFAIKKTATGIYSASGLTLSAGKQYWHHVHLGKEKATVDLSVK